MRLRIRYALAAVFLLSAHPQAALSQTAEHPNAGMSVVEGRYQICREAFMHSEHLELASGRYVHHIATDIPPPQRDSGQYSVRGDTLIMPLEVGDWMLDMRKFRADQGAPPELLGELFPVERRMIIDNVQGRPVLWRTPAMKAEFLAGGRIGQYSLLVYQPPEDSREGPACRAIGILP
jgi:hypothetical protein